MTDVVVGLYRPSVGLLRGAADRVRRVPQDPAGPPGRPGAAGGLAGYEIVD